jgi:hypothetical protein
MNLLISEYEKYNRIMPFDFIRQFGSGPNQGREVFRWVKLEASQRKGTS